jgi:hypothetical protein
MTAADKESRADNKYVAKPCPFCGSAPVVAAAGYATIHCVAADCFGPRTTAEYLTDALKQWNTRATLPLTDPLSSGHGVGLEVSFGEYGYNPDYDDGITFAICQLAALTGSKDWQMRDGSEDHDTDVRDTIMDVLKCAGLYDDETGKFAAIQNLSAEPVASDEANKLGFPNPPSSSGSAGE